MWFSEGKLRFIFSTPNRDEEEEIQKQIGGLYPNANISSSNRLMPKIPEKAISQAGNSRSTTQSTLRFGRSVEKDRLRETRMRRSRASWLVTKIKQSSSR